MSISTTALSVTKTSNSRVSIMEKGTPTFGKVFSDHMFVADYVGGSWQNPRIEPYAKLELEPSCLVFHYGQAIFEGMKAYRTDDGRSVLFRPDANAARFNKSAKRMCMPEVPMDMFLEGLRQLVALDSNWIPTTEGGSLYIRPFMIATDEYLGVKASETYKFVIITCPVGPYYSEPVRVRIETEYTRAFEGGTGFAKAAGNYAAALVAAKKAVEDGYHQMVWTDGREHKYIEEAGTMNMMFVINNTLITPPLSTTILAGVTRDSFLTLARDMGYTVEERRISIDEILAAAAAGTLEEAFGTGTAATVAPIILMNYKGKDYSLPPLESRKLSPSITKRLDGIKTGKEADKFNWLMEAK